MPRLNYNIDIYFSYGRDRPTQSCSFAFLVTTEVADIINQ